MPQSGPRYFDMLLDELENGDSAIAQAYSRHVHWGYWDDPASSTNTPEDLASATETMTLQLCELAGITEGHHVLDAGCGFGGTLASLNERYRSVDLTGLNIDERQIARARQQVLPLNGNTVSFDVGNACALPYADNSFDRILAVECIFEFPSRETFLREAARVLKPGGVLALSDYVSAPAFLPLAYAAAMPWVQNVEGSGRFDVRVTSNGYRALAARTGLTLLSERNITPHTMPTYAHLRRLALPQLAGLQVQGFKVMMGLLKLWARTGLLKYSLLSLQKPATRG